jgi:hypothetical protein
MFRWSLDEDDCCIWAARYWYSLRVLEVNPLQHHDHRHYALYSEALSRPVKEPSNVQLIALAVFDHVP